MGSCFGVNFFLNEESKYVFSQDKNVIVVVLDTFQTDVFQELINENPGYKKDFAGFTYFRNSLGGYPSTFLSIPLILTGQYYDNSQPEREYLKDAFSSISLPFVLKKEGYRVDLFTDSRLIYLNNEIASNITKNGSNFYYVSHLYNVSFFRAAPHYAKKYFYVVKGITEGSEPYEGDLSFAQKIVTETRLGGDLPTFKFYHLWATHPPFNYDESLEPKKIEFTRAGYKSQAKGAMMIVKRLLDTFKKEGIYDNTMFVIVGDHGTGASGSFGLNLEASGYKQEHSAEALTTSVETVASGLPLILVKPFKSQGDLKISDAPVSLSDVAKTIFSELDIDVNSPGRSMFSVQESEERKRRFLKYQWENENIKNDYLSAMEEYFVQGFSWLQESWKPSYHRFTQDGVVDTSPPKYQYGVPITFGLNGNSTAFQGTGWGSPEDGFIWTIDHNASMIIPVDMPTKDIKLKVSMFPLVGGVIESQVVEVHINGNTLGEWNVSNDGEYILTIPKEIINEEKVTLEFRIPKATSPISLKIGDDQRILGIAVKKIVMNME